MIKIRFRDLIKGERFVFAAEDQHAGMARGPWVKESERTYKHADTGMLCRVGTVNVEIKVKS